MDMATWPQPHAETGPARRICGDRPCPMQYEMRRGNTGARGSHRQGRLTAQMYGVDKLEPQKSFPQSQRLKAWGLIREATCGKAAQCNLYEPACITTPE